MSELPISDGGMMSCCIDTIRSFDGRDDDGVSIACDTCAKKLVVKAQRWIWRPVGTGVKRTEIGSNAKTILFGPHD